MPAKVSHPYQDVSEFREVAVELGWLVISCAELEWLTFQAIRKIEPDQEIAKKMAVLDFKERILALRRVSAQHCASSEALDEWLLLWERVCSLLQDRNAFLHNSMMVNVYESIAGDEVEFRRELVTFRNPSSRFDGSSLVEIRKAVQKAASYSSDAFRLFTKIGAWGR